MWHFKLEMHIQAGLLYLRHVHAHIFAVVETIVYIVNLPICIDNRVLQSSGIHPVETGEVSPV